MFYTHFHSLQNMVQENEKVAYWYKSNQFNQKGYMYLQTASKQSCMACSAKHACSVQIHRVCVCVCVGGGGGGGR